MFTVVTFLCKTFKEVLPIMKKMSTGRQIAIYFVIFLLTAVLVSMVAEWVRKYKIPCRIEGLFLERHS